GMNPRVFTELIHLPDRHPDVLEAIEAPDIRGGTVEILRPVRINLDSAHPRGFDFAFGVIVPIVADAGAGERALVPTLVSLQSRVFGAEPSDRDRRVVLRQLRRLSM